VSEFRKLRLVTERRGDLINIDMSVHPEVDDKHDNELAVDYELDPVDNIPLGNSLPHSPTKNNAKYFSL